MKEISVGVCLNEYTWLEIWEKKKKSGLFKKTKWKKKFEKKMVLNKSKKEKNEERKKSRSAIWALLCKVSGIDVIRK